VPSSSEGKQKRSNCRQCNRGNLSTWL